MESVEVFYHSIAPLQHKAQFFRVTSAIIHQFLRISSFLFDFILLGKAVASCGKCVNNKIEWKEFLCPLRKNLNPITRSGG
jgi:hypothetical protein